MKIIQNMAKSASVISIFHGELLTDSCSIIEQALSSSYRTVNEILIKRNWLLGMRIQHEVLKNQRADYGEKVVVGLFSIRCGLSFSTQ